MSDGSLSQDEIDALLQGGGGLDVAGPETGGGELSAKEIEDFQQLLTDISTSVSSNLSGMIDETVDIQQPLVEIVDSDELNGSISDEVVEIKIDFTQDLSGEHLYLIPKTVANSIAGKMMGMADVELNEAALQALEEAGNTIAGSAATAIGDKTGKTVMTSPGQTKIAGSGGFSVPPGRFVKVTSNITIDGNPPADLIEIYELPLVKSIVGGQAAAPSDGGMDAAFDFGGGMGAQPQQQQPMGQMDPMGGMAPMGGADPMGQTANVQQIQFPNLYPQTGAGDQGNIGLLMDVYMEMTVELGRTKRLIREILSFGEGTIIELDKLAGEPVDILVNHKLIAKGEVVVIEENFGVRVTEIVSPMDRVQDLT